MNYALLRQLLEHLEAYENTQTNNASFTDFLLWMNYQHFQPASAPLADRASQPPIESEISRRVGMIWKYAKLYVKKALQHQPLNSVDDFGFLATLAEAGEMTKTALINANVTEIPSGMEVIKRLEKNGFLETCSDADDRRAVRVRLTTAGRTAFLAALQAMQAAAHLIGGDLSPTEKFQLLLLLHKLEQFHEKIFEHDRKSDLADLLAKYLPASAL